MTASPILKDLSARFRAVLHYIDAHLDETIHLDRLSDVACLSKFHFHRQFAAYFRLGVSRYVRLTRLKRASYQLAFRPELSVLEIAARCGYEGPEAFARAFKRDLDQSPSQFRAQPDWSAWQRVFQPLRELRIDHMIAQQAIDRVQLVQFEAVRVAALEHRGDPAALPDSIGKFIAWRKEQRLPPAKSATFNILYDDPEETEPEAFRMDLCAATEMEIASNASGISAKTIPSGRCALLRHVGSDETLGESIRWLYSAWLPTSGATLRDYPLFTQRVRFFPDVPEHEVVTDIYLPID